jgi:ribosomal protein L37AE/L43A
MEIKACPKCKSKKVHYNKNNGAWYCDDCHAIWYEYNQQVDTSPNKSTPRKSSSDKTSKDES